MAEITYFEKGGPQNTNSTLKIAKERFEKGDIDTVLVASSFGDTAIAAVDLFQDAAKNIIVVGEVLEGKQSPVKDTQMKLEAAGCKVIWGVPMGGMSVFTKDKTAARMADTFRRTSEGHKVVCEITLIATSQGFVESGKKVLAIGGTHRGADTAVVANSAAFNEFSSFQVHEILCKPYSRE